MYRIELVLIIHEIWDPASIRIPLFIKNAWKTSWLPVYTDDNIHNLTIPISIYLKPVERFRSDRSMHDLYKKNWSLIEEFLDYLKALPEFSAVRFLILYGSMADKTADVRSDIDIAVSCDLPGIEAERFRIFLMGRVPDSFDIHIFEHLPLYIRIEVLKGKVLFVKDEDELYDTAYRTIREYELFKPHYLDYIGEKAL